MMADEVILEDDNASVTVEDVLEEGEIREEDDEFVAESKGAQPPFVFNAKLPDDDNGRQRNCSGAVVGDGLENFGSFGPFNDLIKKGCFGPFSTRLLNVVNTHVDPRPHHSNFSGRNFDGSFIKIRKIHRSPNIGHRDQLTNSSISSDSDLSPSEEFGDANSSPTHPPIPPSPLIDLNSSPCQSSLNDVTNLHPHYRPLTHYPRN
ncbi:hypothetical protein L2E82_19720 [Cichorium intybus]|uniref:Uncharacterized protein n=1 Tax=Cichorium intybus TaxID=13427 RepID=A0ACB9FC52_CICIN|nr:hypothetical protein L2E82_19720 [Cichorium intybus]